MMKLNRILSAAVAMAMSFTMFAGAVSLDAAADAPETETLTGVAYVCTPEGRTEQEFEYTIPVDATEEEEAEIASQAAKVAVGKESLMSRANSRSYYDLYELNYMNFDRANGGTGTRLFRNEELPARNGEVEFYLKNIAGCSSVRLSLKKGGNSTEFWQSEDVDVSSKVSVYFVSGGRYPNYTLYFDEGDLLSGYIGGNTAGYGFVGVTYYY